MSKKLKLEFGSDGEFFVTEKNDEEKQKRKVPLGGDIFVSESNKLHFVPSNRFEEFDQFFENFVGETTKMNVTAVNMDKIIKIAKQIIETQTKSILNSLKIENQSNDEIVETINQASQQMIKQFETISTSKKRLQKFQKNELFVEPKEISLALKWQTKISSDNDLPSHNLITSTCQYVSIRKTLSAIFSQSDFRTMYTIYN